jgi:hypothetical protein
METAMKTKFAAIALGALTLASAFTMTSTQAQAGNYGKYVAYGIAGAVVLGAIASQAHAYPTYAKTKHCQWVPQYNAYGYFIGNAKVCSWY